MLSFPLVGPVDTPGGQESETGAVAGGPWVPGSGDTGTKQLTQLSRSAAVSWGVKSPRSGWSSAPPGRRLMEIQ